MPTGPEAPISPCEKQRTDTERYWQDAGEGGVKPLFPDSKLICGLHLPLSEPMKETRCGVQRGACCVAWLAGCYLPYQLPPSATGQKKIPCVFSLSLFFETEQIDVTCLLLLLSDCWWRKRIEVKACMSCPFCDMVRVTVQQRWQGQPLRLAIS